MSKIYLLNNIKFENVENLDVFGIDFIKSDIDLSEYDALIFTSKNAIYSIDSFNRQWQQIPSYAIAPKTASIIKNYKGKLSFIGKSSHGDSFAEELIPFLQNKKVLYIRALKTVSNLVNILKNNNITIDELISYKTSCKRSYKTLEKGSIFVFTSPSSIECFFKSYSWHESYKAVVIGKTTANYLPKSIKYVISTKTSIEECIKIAQEMAL